MSDGRTGIVNHWTCIYFCMDTQHNRHGRSVGGGSDDQEVAEEVERGLAAIERI